jgi:hypothetical protein
MGERFPMLDTGETDQDQGARVPEPVGGLHVQTATSRQAGRLDPLLQLLVGRHQSLIPRRFL